MGEDSAARERVRSREELRRKRQERRRKRRARRLHGADQDASLARRLRELQRALILRVGKNTRPFFNRWLARYSTVGDASFPDPALFPWIPALEARADAIRKELDVLLEFRDRLPPLGEVSPDHDRIARDDRWKAFFLYGYGYPAARAARHCPETMRALEVVPNLQSAFFSILLPGMHIKKHKGPTKSLLVCHLGLKVPRSREDCRIRVGKEFSHWEEGRVLVLDDTRQHEVWNDTDEERVVLLIHILRPLRFPGSLVGRLLYAAIRRSPFVQDGLKNQAAWADAFETYLAERDAGPAGA